MFFFQSIRSRKKKIHQLNEEIIALNEQKIYLEDIIRGLKEEQSKEMTKAAEAFQFSLDFDKMDIFSIERVMDGHKAKTIVGHFVKGEVKEWVLYASAKEHNRLIAEFELWKEKRKQ